MSWIFLNTTLQTVLFSGETIEQLLSRDCTDKKDWDMDQYQFSGTKNDCDHSMVPNITRTGSGPGISP